MEVYNQSETEFVCNFIGDINRIDPRMVENSRLNDVVQPGNIAYIRNEKVSLRTCRYRYGPIERQDRGPGILRFIQQVRIEIAGGGRLKTIEIESRFRPS